MWREKIESLSRAEQSRAEQSRAEQLDVCQIGNVMPSVWGERTNQGRVYDINGISPCIDTMQGGGRQPHIVEVRDMNEVIIAKGSDGTVGVGIVNTKSADNIRTIKIRQATKDGFIDCEIGGVADLDYPSSQTRRGRVIEGGVDLSHFSNGEYP